MHVTFATRFERVFGPLPGRREARAISVFALITGGIICALSFFYGSRGETFLGRHLGGDFVEFYSVGKILNGYDAARIYDIQLVAGIEHQSAPAMPETQMLIYGNAPFVGLLFQPLAMLPYAWAYALWLALSFGLYVWGLRLLFRENLNSGQIGPATFLALSCSTFLLECWIGGQLSVLAFIAFALCFDLLDQRRVFAAGFSLALASYKPSLLAIPALMLIFGACWRMLAGLSVGITAAGILSLRVAGVHGCVRWFETLRVFGQLVTGPAAALRRVKYVDLNSFFAVLLSDHPNVARLCAGSITIVALVFLSRAWSQSRRLSPERRKLLWAATLCWTLILNVYVPVYDTILVIVAAALTAGALQRRQKEDHRIFAIWLVLLYIVPWLTQAFAEFLHVQLFTLLLAGFGYWNLSRRTSLFSFTRNMRWVRGPKETAWNQI